MNYRKLHMFYILQTDLIFFKIEVRKIILIYTVKIFIGKFHLKFLNDIPRCVIFSENSLHTGIYNNTSLILLCTADISRIWNFKKIVSGNRFHYFHLLYIYNNRIPLLLSSMFRFLLSVPNHKQVSTYLLRNYY